MTASRVNRPLEVGGRSVAPGETARFDLPVALLPTHTELNLPLTVMHGRRPGPCVWVSAAVHGDELNGVEIIARVLDRLAEPLLRGSLIAAPIVNVFGFIGQSRYLPDRRDLNRSFPGSQRGSLASRVAHVFMREVVEHCSHGIDLHTAAEGRSNLPQIRADLTDPATRAMAEAFRAPCMIQSDARQGSLRAAARKRGTPIIVYEGGEAFRFNEPVIRAGVRGVLSVLNSLGLVARKPRAPGGPTLEIQDTTWVRARRGGLLRLEVEEGDVVEERQPIGFVADPFGADRVQLRAPFRGLVIGLSMNPVVHGGDAVVHLGALPRG